MHYSSEYIIFFNTEYLILLKNKLTSPLNHSELQSSFSICLIHNISFNCTIQWSDFCIYCEMTTTVSPVILCHLTKLVQCHWLLSPSCTSYIPIAYLFCNCKFVPLDPLHLFHPFQSRLLWQPPTSSLNLWVFTCFVDPTCKWNQAVFVFLVFHLTSYPWPASVLLSAVTQL